MTKNEWKDKYSCSGGFDEFLVNFIVHCDDDDYQLEASVDVCESEVDKVKVHENVGNKELGIRDITREIRSISNEKLTNLIRDEPEKILDIYVYNSDIGDIQSDESCGLEVHETNNSLFRSLDRSTTIAQVRFGKLDVEHVLEND